MLCGGEGTGSMATFRFSVSVPGWVTLDESQDISLPVLGQLVSSLPWAGWKDLTRYSWGSGGNMEALSKL